MPDAEHMKAAIERIHDIADTLKEAEDLSPRAKQAFDEIAAIAHPAPLPTPELAVGGDGPFALGGGSIMDGKEGVE